ncbi:MAG: B12-binding domain-containing radical SAM protein [Candidatus Melainabacteria bacterium HGW-Melainabacteria-1]|nr:MAG: B12-binding domain-containing radical SAM protein [Candidatus Melainabacteria bacterium HGW-Melainabacteria-1]
MTKQIVLTTLNARYAHTALGLRYLYANLQELQDQAVILEFIIKDQTAEIAERILSEAPRIIGFGVYIWNALETRAVIHLIKKVAPQIQIVLGGPEVSYLPQRVAFEADYVISGEGDTAFYTLCKALLDGTPPEQRQLGQPPPELAKLSLPYDFYTDHDLRQRITYVEASRGCPFSCEFCLSSLDQKVRKFDTDLFIEQLESLWQRGARNFKFIDRTFNLQPQVTNRILDFFLSKSTPYFAHFEMIPDHFPEHLKDKLRQFAPTSLQLEIGIQSLNPEVSGRIKRKLKPEVVEANIRYLAEQTQAHLHLDLIVGLPGESLESFGHNLNALASWADAEIQIGILKKLSGTDLFRHDQSFGMVYSDLPPYEILQNNLISFQQMQVIKRFARFWDLTYNSGNFRRSIRLLWPDGDVYTHFGAFSDWLYAQTQATGHIALLRLAELLFKYLTGVKNMSPDQLAPLLLQDLESTQGTRCPAFLKAWKLDKPQSATAYPKALKRQAKRALQPQSDSAAGVNLLNC